MDKVRLKDFVHAQWGTIVGQEKKIRIAVLKEEVEVFKSKIEPDSTGHLYTTISTLEHRIKELEHALPFNDAQMLNGTFEGDSISQKGKNAEMVD